MSTIPVACAPFALQVESAIRLGEIEMPPLPEVVRRIHECLVGGERADARQLARLVESEPAIATAVLRVANSAAFGGMHRVETLDDAILRLGLRQIGALATTVAHRGHFRSNDPGHAARLRALWEHAVATAVGARRLAEGCGDDPADAYLAGLLHDSGKLIVLKAADWIERRSGVRTPAAVLDDVIGLLHARIGFQTLGSWRIPAGVCEVVLLHHAPASPDDTPLLVQIRAANLVARHIGAHAHPDPAPDLGACPEIQRLGLEPAQIDALCSQVAEECRELRDLLGSA